MTFFRQRSILIVLECNYPGCEEQFFGVASLGVEALREVAAEEGWASISRHGQDRCENHNERNPDATA